MPGERLGHLASQVGWVVVLGQGCAGYGARASGPQGAGHARRFWAYLGWLARAEGMQGEAMLGYAIARRTGVWTVRELRFAHRCRF